MFTDMNIQEVIAKYNSGDSMNELARKYNTTPYKIKKILLKNNINIRSRYQQNIISNMKRTKGVNHNYFNNITTTNQAWLLGFLAADGWIEANRNRINIELSEIDIEILEKIKKEMEIENPIMKRITEKGFSIVRLSWTSGVQKVALKKYGIINRKTYKEMHLPQFKDTKLIDAFILGYFDGDGSISISDNYCRFRLCAHRPELLQDIKKYLNIPSSFSQDNRGLYEFSISTTYSVPLLNKLYNNNSLYLARKKEKFLEYNKSKRV